jgi:serine/threonine protein phosphatase 1
LSKRILAIGDIHGCLKQLDSLLDAILPGADDQIVGLGDYVDRGPDSAGVLKRLMSLSKRHALVALLGNHEEMMLAARAEREKFSDWILNGGDATLRSYGGVRGALKDVPEEHWNFIEQSFVSHFETDTHLFVHANAYPDLPMSEQPNYMLRWERCDTIAPHESGKTIVCGHTPQKSGRPINRGYAICLDTNACRGGPLTCLDSISGKVWQAAPDGRVERGHISDFSDH